MNKLDLEAARSVAFRFLGYSARSRAEIVQRLERDSFPPEIIAAVVAELEAQNYVNDAQFARDWVQDRANRKRYGRARLTAELRRRGVDRENIAEAISEDGEDAELARALAAAEQKWRPEQFADTDSPTVQAERKRLASFLIRRGFSWPIVEQVFARMVEKLK